MARVARNLYAFEGLSPICDDLGGCVTLCCYPIDFDAQENIVEDTRYVALVFVPDGFKVDDVLRAYADMRPYSYHWLSYCWEV